MKTQKHLKKLPITFSRSALRRPYFMAVATAAALIAIHISLVWKIDDSNLFFSSTVFWLAAYLTAKEVRYQCPQKFNIWSIGLGVGILGITVFQGMQSSGNFLYLYPFLAGIGLLFTFGGLRDWQNYLTPLLLLFFLGVPEIIFFALVDPAPLTARFSDMLLWYSGHDVVRQGITLHMAGGSVDVVQSCSGLRAMVRMLSMSVLVLLCLPRQWSKAELVGLPLLGIAIAFVSNGIRVALLALLKSKHYEAAFHSLHGGNTSQLFSIGSIILFMSIIWWLIQRNSQVANAQL